MAEVTDFPQKTNAEMLAGLNAAALMQAKVIKVYFDAMVAAGFTAEQAMELCKAHFKLK